MVTPASAFSGWIVSTLTVRLFVWLLASASGAP